MLCTALVACGLAMAAVLAQVDDAPQTRASVEQLRLSMNAPPATLMDELDRLMQASWTERIPNRRYARIDPVTTAATPSGSFAGELFEESQPLPTTGTQAPTLASALAGQRHRALLLLDLYATALVIGAIGLSLAFVRNFDVGAPWQENRFSLAGTAAILAFVAAFCFQAAARLWGRFNFESVLVWVEMMGNWQTSRIGTGNNFTSRVNTENSVVRTEAMTLARLAGADRIGGVRQGRRAPGDGDVLDRAGGPGAGRRAGRVRPRPEHPGGAVQRRGRAPDRRPRRRRAGDAGRDRRAAGLGGADRAAAVHRRRAGIGRAPARRQRRARPPGRRFCRMCGVEAPAGARFCAACAAPLDA